MSLPNRSTEAGGARSRWTWVAWVLLALALAYFTYRGPMRAIHASGDFKELYAPSRALLHGANGYDLATARAYWMRAGVPETATPHEVDLGLLYPPSTMVMMLPFGALEWPEARAALAAVNTLCVALIVVGLICLAQLRWNSMQTILLAAMTLALAPIHSALTMGQPVLLSVALLVWGLVLARRRRDGWAGLLVGLAAAFKVQLALPFVAYYLLRGRWRLAGVGAIALAVPMLIAIGILESSGGAWFTDWTANLTEMRQGGYADPTLANESSRYKLINLYYPLYLILGNRAAAELLAMAFATAAGIALVLHMNRDRLGRGELLAMSIVGVLSLLPVYHLFYDASLLVIPIAWAFAAWVTGRRRWAGLVLLLCAPFLVPGAAAIGQWTRSGRLPAWLFEQSWFQVTILAHQCWLLLLLAVALIVALWRIPLAVLRENPQPSSDAAGR